MSIFLKFFNFIFKDLFIISNIFNKLVSYYKNLLTYDFYELDDIEFDVEDKKINDNEKIVYYNYGAKNVRELYKKSYFNFKSFLFIDLIWSKLFSKKFLLNNTTNFRSNFRVYSTKQGFYFNLLKLKNRKNFKIFLMNTFFSGFKYIWLGLRF